MSFTYVQPIPTPQEIADKIPMPENLKKIKAERDAELKDILTEKSSKFIVIVGPCSADNEDAVCEYVTRLAKVEEKVRDKLFIIPRVYTNKPRTTGEGYKGMLHQPDPQKAPNMYEGILALRQMHIKTVQSSHLTSADEMLYPDNLVFIEDVLSYIAIGARSVENQQHRLVVSGIDLPVGMKNPTSGDLSVMLNSIVAAQSKHTFLYQNWEVDTSGNPLTHAILRGSVNKKGHCIPNYHYEDLLLLSELYEERKLENPSVIIDANHSNSNKCFYEQPRIVKEILHSRSNSRDLHKLVRGLMIESYLEEGNQKVGENIYGKSITDACLGWEDTEQLLYYIADKV